MSEDESFYAELVAGDLRDITARILDFVDPYTDEVIDATLDEAGVEDDLRRDDIKRAVRKHVGLPEEG